MKKNLPQINNPITTSTPIKNNVDFLKDQEFNKLLLRESFQVINKLKHSDMFLSFNITNGEMKTISSKKEYFADDNLISIPITITRPFSSKKTPYNLKRIIFPNEKITKPIQTIIDQSFEQFYNYQTQ
tara:strand:- start:255 stop:638 length:384 start_codon:yes stop_codon:yes gene_type:complete